MLRNLRLLLIFLLLINAKSFATDFCIKPVTKRRFQWEKILRLHIDRRNERSIEQALSISEPYHAELVKAEAELTAISPKDFTNPFWWPAVQKVYTLRKEAAGERPPSELDRITVWEFCE